MFDDDSGADFLPARLFVVLIIATLLLVIMASGVGDLSGTYSVNRARAEAERVAEFARMAYCSDTPDSTTDKSIYVSIPASVLLLAYGAVPGNGTPVRMDRSYYLEYTDGRTEIFVTDIPFACDRPEGPVDMPVLLYPGEYRIKARPVTVNGDVKAGLSTEAA